MPYPVSFNLSSQNNESVKESVVHCEFSVLFPVSANILKPQYTREAQCYLEMRSLILDACNLYSATNSFHCLLKEHIQLLKRT